MFTQVWDVLRTPKSSRAIDKRVVWTSAWISHSSWVKGGKFGFLATPTLSDSTVYFRSGINSEEVTADMNLVLNEDYFFSTKKLVEVLQMGFGLINAHSADTPLDAPLRTRGGRRAAAPSKGPVPQCIGGRGSSAVFSPAPAVSVARVASDSDGRKRGRTASDIDAENTHPQKQASRRVASPAETDL
jgi:hypothetical protein